MADTITGHPSISDFSLSHAYALRSLTMWRTVCAFSIAFADYGAGQISRARPNRLLFLVPSLSYLIVYDGHFERQRSLFFISIII